MYEKILIRYGELTLKGKNRDSFITQLARNIKVITGEYPEIKYDRMFLSYSEYLIIKNYNMFLVLLVIARLFFVKIILRKLLIML